MLRKPLPVMHQEVVVALVIGMQRRRICLGRPASNAAIATSCHTSGSGGCACFRDAVVENLFGTARQQRLTSPLANSSLLSDIVNTTQESTIKMKLPKRWTTLRASRCLCFKDFGLTSDCLHCRRGKYSWNRSKVLRAAGAANYSKLRKWKCATTHGGTLLCKRRTGLCVSGPSRWGLQRMWETLLSCQEGEVWWGNTTLLVANYMFKLREEIQVETT